MISSLEELRHAEASKQVALYNRESKRRFLTYLGLAFWQCDSILGLVIKTNLWHMFLLLIWFVLLCLVIRRDLKERKTYLENLAILQKNGSTTNKATDSPQNRKETTNS
jgi:hypothetical protein